MYSEQAIDFRQLRASDERVRAKWIAYEVDGGYVVRCDGAVLCTVNTKQTRIFKSLDTVLRNLSEMGVKEFEVVAKEAAA